MRKKSIISLLFLPVFLLVGCGKKIAVYDSMSEQTKIYYYGESESLECSISVGEREKQYIIDGNHGNNCDFSLIVLKLKDETAGDMVKVKIAINGKNDEIMLELNPLNMTYMADLGYALDERDKIEIVVGKEGLFLENISENFKVDYKKAISLAMEKMENKKRFYQGNSFKGECYLKILNGTQFGGQGFYWCFNIVGEEENSNNILINVYDENEIMQG